MVRHSVYGECSVYGEHSVYGEYSVQAGVQAGVQACYLQADQYIYIYIMQACYLQVQADLMRAARQRLTLHYTGPPIGTSFEATEARYRSLPVGVALPHTSYVRRAAQ
jgi:hypothetical protein